MFKRWKVQAVAITLTVGLAACGDDSVRPADPDDIGAWAELLGVPGVSVAVINDFQVDYVEVHGVMDESTGEPVTPTTLFQAASISKGVSAVGVMTLVQDGILTLDTDINHYLTSWQLPDHSGQNSQKATIRRLLSHTAGTTVSGFRGYRYSESVPTLLELLNGQAPANSPPIYIDVTPGSQFRYSGGGYEVVELAVRDVTGIGFPQLIQERVLAPLGMANSTYEQPLPESLRARAPQGYYANGSAVPGGHHIYPEIAAAALWTTPTDVARFVIEIQRSLRGESNRILTRENTQLLITEVRNRYGLGFALRSLRGETYFWHAGANDGFRCAMIAHPDGHGLVLMTNSDRGSDLYENVIPVIASREDWPGY
jgi:CubicO group peptidase (beta-lactamase class C family)